MYLFAVIVQSALILFFRLVLALVILRIAVTPFELTDNVFVRLICVITEPVLAPARWLLSKVSGRFAMPYDFSYFLVIAVLSALLVIY